MAQSPDMIRNYANIQYLVYCITGVEDTPKGLWIKTVIDFIEDGRKSRPPLYPYLSKNYWQDLNDFRYLQLEIAVRMFDQDA